MSSARRNVARSVHKVKGHLVEPLCPGVAGEGGLISIYFCHGYPPITLVGLECREP